MKVGLQNLCGALSAVLSIMGAMSAMAGMFNADKNLYIQAVVSGLAGAGVALAALLRM